MDITSPPAFLDETVTDVDILYVGGTVDSLTLRATDTYDVTPYTIVVKTPTETITCERKNMLSWRTRQRVHRTMLDKEGKPIRLPGAIQS